MEKQTEIRMGALIVASLDWHTEPMLPMLPLEGTTVIKHMIYQLKQAGVSNIVVLGGYQAEVLKKHLSHHNIMFYEDTEFEKHTILESIETIWDKLCAQFDRMLICLAGSPAFSSETIKALLEQDGWAVPAYGGKIGFPWICVMEKNLFQEKRDWLSELKKFSLLHEKQMNLPQISVQDEGILFSVVGNGIETIQKYVASRRNAQPLRIKTKMILCKEQDFFGPGIYKLLMKVQSTGSIQAAANQMEMSYTKAWKMINKIEKEMGFPFLRRINGGKKGGSSELTEEGLRFLKRYQTMEEDLKRISQNLFEVYFLEFSESGKWNRKD